MILMKSRFDVADNTGARVAQCIHVLGQRKMYAHIGDVIKVAIKEAQPVGLIKKGEVCDAVIVRTNQCIRRPDGNILNIDHNSCELVAAEKNPRGTRIFRPVARELRDMNFMKIISLAPEVI